MSIVSSGELSRSQHHIRNLATWSNVCTMELWVVKWCQRTYGLPGKFHSHLYRCHKVTCDAYTDTLLKGGGSNPKRLLHGTPYHQFDHRVQACMYVYKYLPNLYIYIYIYIHTHMCKGSFHIGKSSDVCVSLYSPFQPNVKWSNSSSPRSLSSRGDFPHGKPPTCRNYLRLQSHDHRKTILRLLRINSNLHWI